MYSMFKYLHVYTYVLHTNISSLFWRKFLASTEVRPLSRHQSFVACAQVVLHGGVYVLDLGRANLELAWRF